MPSIATMPPLRRKKWTEEEERTLIDKYREMLFDGTLAKMKTREKKFRPIAAQVNAMHHARDPVSFPWQWTWKDASTKVQNMRHQYLLVKQKIKKPAGSGGALDGEVEDRDEFDWDEGLTHWPNFLRYKDVFGDIALVFNESAAMNSRENGASFSGSGRAIERMRIGVLDQAEAVFEAGIDGCENGVLALGLGFEYDGEEGDELNREKDSVGEGFDYEEVEPSLESRKKRKRLKGLEKRAWSLLSNQFAQLKEREARLEEREAERELERQRRELFQVELEEERERTLKEWETEREERERDRENSRRERVRQLELMEKEIDERVMRRREEELIKEREWEERMDRRRLEWRKRIDDMVCQHRRDMDQIQSRIIHEQQSVVNQLLGIVSQWTGHSGGLTDHTSAGNPYISQMMQNLHHVNGIVHGENRVGGDNTDDQFIVDG